MNSSHQIVAGVVGTATGAGGFAGFMLVADPYIKALIAVLTVVALTTTIVANKKKINRG